VRTDNCMGCSSKYTGGRGIFCVPETKTTAISVLSHICGVWGDSIGRASSFITHNPGASLEWCQSVCVPKKDVIEPHRGLSYCLSHAKLVEPRGWKPLRPSLLGRAHVGCKFLSVWARLVKGGLQQRLAEGQLCVWEGTGDPLAEGGAVCVRA
jgi:hypothetical protein